MKKMFAKSKTGLFATTTLSGHLIRGAMAFGLVETVQQRLAQWRGVSAA